MGRSQDNTVSLSDKKISRLHAKIERIGTTYQLRDLESGNGTRINGRKIDFQTLSIGDEIRLGDTLLTVQGFDEEEIHDDEDTSLEVVEKTPVPLPQKLQVKDKIDQVKSLNSEAPAESPPPAP
jgi:adenylate cyclase